MCEDERRRSKLPGDIAEDNPVLGNCPRQTEVTEGKSGTPPKAASQSVPRESTSAMSQLWEYSGGAIQGETVTSTLNAHN